MEENLTEMESTLISNPSLRESILLSKISRSGDSLDGIGQVWTGVSIGGCPSFRYITRGVHIVVGIERMCLLEAVGEVDWYGLEYERGCLEKWLNELSRKTGIPNWVEVLDAWNNEHSFSHVKVLYNVNEEPFDLDLVCEGEILNPDVYPRIVFV